MTGNLPTILTIESPPLLVHRGARVVTTEFLAQLYGADAKNIQMNFARNEDRFEVDKHFFRLEGDELREAKHKPTLCGLAQV
jgi:hypothetical protein